LFSSAVDPFSGQPELKHAAVTLSLVKPLQQMVLYTREAIEQSVLAKLSDYYVITVLEHAFMYRLALLPSSLSANEDWLNTEKLESAESKIRHAEDTERLETWKTQISQCLAEQYEVLSFADEGSTNSHSLALDAGKLQLFCHTTNPTSLSHSEWLNHLFAQASLEPEQINRLLQHRPEPSFLLGKQICSCFKVHEDTIVDAIKKGTATVSDLGASLKCGTNCGSCKSELKQLIEQHSELNSNPNKIDISVEI